MAHNQQSSFDCENSDEFPFDLVFKAGGFVRVDGLKQVTVQAGDDVMPKLRADITKALNPEQDDDEGGDE